MKIPVKAAQEKEQEVEQTSDEQQGQMQEGQAAFEDPLVRPK